MALSQAERSAKTAAKREKVGEEELRLRVRAGTKAALADLMKWAEVEEQGEALTLMIHHVQALGQAAMLHLLRHEMVAERIVPQAEIIRFGARPGTMTALDSIASWAITDTGITIEWLIHAVRALGQARAVKFLTPPKHEVRLSNRLELDFSRKSMLMLQQDPGDEVIAPSVTR